MSNGWLVSLVVLGCACAGPPDPPPPGPPEPPEVIAQRTPLQMAGPSENGRQSAATDAGGDECRLALARPPRDDCRLLFPTSMAASASTATGAHAADGNTCTVWNAGAFAPQVITLDLGTVTRVDVISLVPEMTPSGAVEHEVAVSGDGRIFQTAHVLRAPMQSGVAAELVLPKPERARFLRITTKASPSHVAWRDIGLFRCGGE